MVLYAGSLKAKVDTGCAVPFFIIIIIIMSPTEVDSPFLLP